MTPYALLLTDLLADAYEEFRWGKTKKERPEIGSDKDTCCKPPTNAAHNSWWAYVRPPDYPRVIGYGKTLEEALRSVYPQLQLGPQQWMTIHGVQNQGNVIASGTQSQISGTTITPSAPGFTLPKVSTLVLEVRCSFLQHLPHCRCMDPQPVTSGGAKQTVQLPQKLTSQNRLHLLRFGVREYFVTFL